MRIFAVLAAAIFIAASAQAAQNRTATPASPAATPAAQSKIDPAKEADIRHLLDLTGAAALAQQVMSAMEQNLKPVMANALPPGEYRDKLVDLFFQKFHSKIDAKALLDLAVARYDENFSRDEIKGLIAFYETPLGRKMTNVLPKLTADLQQDGQKLGEQVGRDSMLQVLAEHPDLAQSLQAASQKASTAPR